MADPYSDHPLARPEGDRSDVVWGTSGGSQPMWLPASALGGAGNSPALAATKGVIPSNDLTGATDAANIQAAINSLRGVGGVVQLYGQNFYTNTTIVTYPGVALQSIGGPLGVGNPVYGFGNLIGVAALNAPIIEIQVDASNPSWLSFPVVSNLTILGTAGNTAQDGILISDSGGTVLDVYLQNVGIFAVGGNGINQTSAAKTWIDRCYLEHCGQNGARFAAGTQRVTQSYIFGNSLFGIDATSAGYFLIAHNLFGQNGQSGTANAVGAIKAGSNGSGGQISANDLFDNGTSTGQAVRVTTLTGSAQVVIASNNFKDSRGASAVPNFVLTSDSGAVNAQVGGNSFVGQTGKAVRVRFDNANENVRIASDNIGLNPYGAITNPISTTHNTLGIVGATATPVASTDYTISQVDQWVVVTGGTGVAITIKDPGGNTLQSGLATFSGLLPQGFKINFGAFTVAPTVASYGN